MGSKRFKGILPLASPTRRRGAAGFTLIELLVVVALVAILLMIAVPSFRSVIERNRIATQVNSFVGDLQVARSEAIKRGVTVSICPSSNGSSCLGANTWQGGWMVFTDPNGNCTLESASEKPVRYRKAWAASDTFVAKEAAATCFSYNREGFANVTAATLIMRTAAANSAMTRCVAINRVGRHIVQSAGQGDCT
jgi:type IV fimbrial biogenesis protein FimT